MTQVRRCGHGVAAAFLLSMAAPLAAQTPAADIATVTRTLGTIHWDLVPSITFSIESISIDIFGPAPPSGYEQFTDHVVIPSGFPIEYDTAGLYAGEYTWKMTLTLPGVPPTVDQQAVREQQILDPDGSYEDAYLAALQASGALPPPGQPLTQAGLFQMSTSTGLNVVNDTWTFTPEDPVHELGPAADPPPDPLPPEPPPPDRNTDPLPPIDLCPGDSGTDPVNDDGCSIAQICPCGADSLGRPWPGPGNYLACVTATAFEFEAAGFLAPGEAAPIIAAAEASECGDHCPGTPPGDGPFDIENLAGCSINQVCPCDASLSPAGYVACVEQAAQVLLSEGASISLTDVLATAEASGCGDQCPDTPPGEFENLSGCSISQLCPCEGVGGVPWATPGEYLACVSNRADEFIAENAGFTAADKEAALILAAASECGDQCPGTPPGEAENEFGCSVSQICPCEGLVDDPWKNHGEYVTCVVDNAKDFYAQGLIDKGTKKDLIKDAAKSDCGKSHHEGHGCKHGDHHKGHHGKHHKCGHGDHHKGKGHKDHEHHGHHEDDEGEDDGHGGGHHGHGGGHHGHGGGHHDD